MAGRRPSHRVPMAATAYCGIPGHGGRL